MIVLLSLSEASEIVRGYSPFFRCCCCGFGGVGVAGTVTDDGVRLVREYGLAKCGNCDKGTVVLNLVEEYRACERPDYVNYGMHDNNPTMYSPVR